MTPLLRAAGTARAVTVDVLSGGGDVLVLAPHPDDETLGCGGAIAALTDLGRRAQVIVVTDGGHSHPASRSTPPERLRQMRAAEVARAVDILTAGLGPEPVLLAYPDTDAPEGDAAVDAALARIVPHMSPSTTAVWSAWGGDPHIDHGRTARLAARLVARNSALAHWSYPIWGRFDPDAADFRPDALVQFETHRWQDRKAAAIAAHVSQMTGLISDDPGGFRMTDAHQRHFLTSPEIFLRETAP
jgi:LmbE family N-acetylglucosaminyl deacetylase